MPDHVRTAAQNKETAHQRPARQPAQSVVADAAPAEPALFYAIADPAAAPAGAILSLQRLAGNQVVSRHLQAKLRVGAVADPLEAEADQAAERVLGTPLRPPVPGPGRRRPSAALVAEEEEVQGKRCCAPAEEEEQLQGKRLLQRAGPKRKNRSRASRSSSAPARKRKNRSRASVSSSAPARKRKNRSRASGSSSAPARKRKNRSRASGSFSAPARKRKNRSRASGSSSAPAPKRKNRSRASAAPARRKRKTVQGNPSSSAPARKRKNRSRASRRAPAHSPGPAVEPGGSFQAGSDVERGIDLERRGGPPLAPEVAGYMEPRFGADFGQVRIHTSNRAASLSQQISAQAFTHGSDIFMPASAYDPGSTAGKRLLAHELAHVVQQGAAGALRKPAVPGGVVQRLGGKKFTGQVPKTGHDTDEYVKFLLPTRTCSPTRSG